jgi:hypothetical protein
VLTALLLPLLLVLALAKQTASWLPSGTVTSKHLAYRLTPQTSVVTLYYSTETETPLNISIIDVTGRVVAQQNTLATQGDNTINLATNQLPQGYYVVELNDGTTKMHEKLLIAR